MLGFALFWLAEPGLPFMVFPYNQNRCSIEDGWVGSAENTHQQDDHKMPNAIAAEQGKGEQSEHNSQLRVDRAIQSLDNGVVDQCFVRDTAIDVGVLADSVKHHDTIVDRKADYGK